MSKWKPSISYEEMVAEMKRQGPDLHFEGTCYDGSSFDMKELPSGICSITSINIHTGQLTVLPDGIALTAHGTLELKNVTSIGNHVTISARHFQMPFVDIIGDHVNIVSTGGLGLDASVIGNHATISVDGNIICRNLYAIGDNSSIIAVGSIDAYWLSEIGNHVFIQAPDGIKIAGKNPICNAINSDYGLSAIVRKRLSKNRAESNRHFTFEKLHSVMEKNGPDLKFNEPIYLHMSRLPDGIRSITVKGDIHAHSLNVLPNGMTIETSECNRYVGHGNIDMYGLCTIEDNVTIKANGPIVAWHLNTIGDNCYIQSADKINASIVTIGNNVVISSKKSIYLRELKTVGRNVSIETPSYIGMLVLAEVGNGFHMTAGECVFQDYAPDQNYLHPGKTAVHEINLSDIDTASDDAIDFLIREGIKVKCTTGSSLINLASRGVSMEIAD